jgi:phosphoribosylformylglycinamidine synthase
MTDTVRQLYQRVREDLEYCYNVALSAPLPPADWEKLRLLLGDGFVPGTVSERPHLAGPRVVEVGPRMNFETAWSTNLVSICRAIHLDAVVRVERSRRYLVPAGEEIAAFAAARHDRMTECVYPEPLATFETGVVPEAVTEVDLLGKGPDALREIPGLSMDDWDRAFYHEYFAKRHRRNPTIVEVMDLNNANSEHSRHGYFRGRIVIDGVEQPESLMDLVKATLAAHPRDSVIAFKDNSSAVAGYPVATLLPEQPGKPAPLVRREATYHVIFTAETHNFPTGVAPFPGAETGTGGRIRDVQGTGRGGFVVAGTAAYCVGNLLIPGYPLPWEQEQPRPGNIATPLRIEIEASNGASDYGNKFGEPLIQGFTRSFDLRLATGERWAWLKPIMFTGGIGQIDARHTGKAAAQPGWRILQIGGPAYRIGFGGGAASSMLQGENVEELDFNAVQRGDAETEQRMNRVIRACSEMGDGTLIEVIHDQGAGGPGNVLKELVEASGGRIDIRKIRVGDPTMSVLEIYVAEYQERNGLLVRPESLPAFAEICRREKASFEDLGAVTGDRRFVVEDSRDGSTPVDLELAEVLGNIPRKTFADARVRRELPPLELPADLTVRDALHDVLRLLAVGSKRFLTNKVDRAVTGLIARQQCCGPLQLTVGDVAVIAQSHLGFTGGATAIGEQPIKMLVDPEAGARMAVGEALTNLVWARVEGLDRVKCSANWMWAPKLPGEGAALYDAARAMRDVMVALGVAVDGGKDSLSMATKVGAETVKSPRELVVSVYAAVPDIRRTVTPDIKRPGESVLLLVDLGGGKNRLGGSALAQARGSVGNQSPDVDDPGVLRRAFEVVQGLLDCGVVLAGHDRSDGGLVTTLCEMAFAGNCGFDVDLTPIAPGERVGDDARTEATGRGTEGRAALPVLFSEELGLVLEVSAEDAAVVCREMTRAEVPCVLIGRTRREKRIAVRAPINLPPRQRVRGERALVLEEDMRVLRGWWEETSHQLERLQIGPALADEEGASIRDRTGPAYSLPFAPAETAPALLSAAGKPRVAILRDEGSNSDREMTAAFHAAGFEPWDVAMTDLLDGRVALEQFRGLAAVGGFSYADVPESAKGWAATILFNPRLKAMFDAFYDRPDTFSLGICNGAQLFGLLGWVPWRGLPAERQPRFVHNRSGRFESRWCTVKVLPSPAIMLRGMEGLVFGIHVDHGEGLLHFPDPAVRERVLAGSLAAVVYVDDGGLPTERYPFNPSGTPGGLTGVTSPDGRHFAMMPHPERCVLPWQCHWLPEEMRRELTVTPWLRMFQNAREWCGERR